MSRRFNRFAGTFFIFVKTFQTERLDVFFAFRQVLIRQMLHAPFMRPKPAYEATR